MALASLADSQDALTRETLAWVGRTTTGSALDLIAQLLRGPRGALDLFAPDDDSERLQMAVAFYRLNAASKALEFLQETDWEGRDLYRAHYWRGRCLEKLEQPRDSLAAYQRALRERPNDVEVLLRIARIQLQQRRPDRAERRLEKVLELDPDNVEGLVSMSYIQGKRQRFERAVDLARRALELDPDNDTARDQYVLYRWRAGMGKPGQGRP
jgi:tetratricopeptide (TPR) repeat protein